MLQSEYATLAEPLGLEVTGDHHAVAEALYDIAPDGGGAGHEWAVRWAGANQEVFQAMAALVRSLRLDAQNEREQLHQRLAAQERTQANLERDVVRLQRDMVLAEERHEAVLASRRDEYLRIVAARDDAWAQYEAAKVKADRYDDIRRTFELLQAVPQP